MYFHFWNYLNTTYTIFKILIFYFCSLLILFNYQGFYFYFVFNIILLLFIYIFNNNLKIDCILLLFNFIEYSLMN